MLSPTQQSGQGLAAANVGPGEASSRARRQSSPSASAREEDRSAFPNVKVTIFVDSRVDGAGRELRRGRRVPSCLIRCKERDKTITVIVVIIIVLTR